jgi:hypothetical protein
MSPSALLAGLMLATSAVTSGNPAADAVITCQRAALEIAGAWTNDGFRLRPRPWAGTLPDGKPALARVTLLAGNRYWFTVATNAASTNLILQIYTAEGLPVTAESHQDGPLAAAGFAPATSGTYIIGISEATGTPVPFCLVYSYK